MSDEQTRDDSSDGTLTWIAAGTAVGLIAGALVAERLSGREITLRSLFDRGRVLATRAAERWEPLVVAALGVRDAWESEVEDDAEDDADDDDLDEDDDDLEDEDEKDDDDLEDEDEVDDAADDEDDAGLDARVLEAFSNDPVLAVRDVEIESVADDTIVLHGRVHTAREVAHAVTIARGVPGVSAVRQLLSVRDRR